jgi:hypothetical protein
MLATIHFRIFVYHLTKTFKIKIYKTIILLLFSMGVKLNLSH